jgi:hypothetical protein
MDSTMKKEAVVRGSKWFRNVLLLVLIGAWFSLGPTFAMAAADSGPCSTNSESRQLDFWLGEWTVTYPGMAGSATSKVFLALDQCLLTESWDGGKGHSGTNMFASSSDDKSWHGMFADNEGRVHIFEGKVAAPGSAEFFGPSTSPDGQAVLNRIRIVLVSPNKVEQTWEKSTDKGANWTTVFRGEYSRKTP